MDFNTYQEKAKTTDLDAKELKAAIANGTVGKNLMTRGFMDKILGLSGEAGEATDKFKKIVRDKNGEVSEEDKAEIVKELGDVLWYLALTSAYLGVPFNEVAEKNIAKLASRKQRGTLEGSGDNR